MAFLPIFAAIYLGLSSTSIGIILTVYTLLISVLQVVMGRIADRFNRKTLVIMGSLINLTFFALIPSAHGFWPLLGLSIWGGLGGAIAVSAASALALLRRWLSTPAPQDLSSSTAAHLAPRRRAR